MLEYLKDYFNEEKYVLSQPNNNPYISTTERLHSIKGQIVKIDKTIEWISIKQRAIEKDTEINEEFNDEPSWQQFGPDITSLLFLLLGKVGIIRRFRNASEFGNLIEQMTRHKKVLILPHLVERLHSIPGSSN